MKMTNQIRSSIAQNTPMEVECEKLESRIENENKTIQQFEKFIGDVESILLSEIVSLLDYYQIREALHTGHSIAQFKLAERLVRKEALIAKLEAEQVKYNSQETLNPAEAVYGFASWLTTRSEQVVMSSAHDAGIVADLVKQFCKENNLPEISDQWPNRLVHPSSEVSVPKDK